jgi:hypothetical protein
VVGVMPAAAAAAGGPQVQQQQQPTAVVAVGQNDVGGLPIIPIGGAGGGDGSAQQTQPGSVGLYKLCTI